MNPVFQICGVLHIVSSEPLCSIKYSMVYLAWVKFVMVLVSGSFLLNSMDVGNFGVG